jgi:hypothetical protein
LTNRLEGWLEKIALCWAESGPEFSGARHLWVTLRYAELNPVRAGLVVGAADRPWSSAAAYCGRAKLQAWLEMPTWRQHQCEASGQGFLGAGETESELRAIRRCTHTARPLGTGEFVEKL